MAHPAIRTPARQLLDARQDHARCLRLAACGLRLGIRDAADMLCSVASAAVSQYRNRLSDHPSGAVRLNRSGLLMRWLSDALCHVITAAEKEARGRSPEDGDDQQLRLSMLAVSTIDNDDPAETAAFARELLAMVEQ